MANKNLTNAKRAKNDEFYTQYSDIQKEIEAYLEFNPDVFRGKVVYCNCDDPFESNFFRYFVLNFNKLGLKQLITTSYKPSPVANTQLSLFGDDKTLPKLKGRPKINANKFIVSEVGDINGDGEFNLKDVAKQLKANKHNEWTPLESDGDFKSPECVELLKQSDIVVTNPPFSLFREYVKQLFDYNKKFVIIGSMNAITYKEIFPLIKENKMWLGNGFHAGNAYFFTPNTRDFASGVYDTKTGLVKFRNCCWFTNLDHGRRHQPLPLMTMEENLKYSKHKEIKGKKVYEKYDNYNAIEVPFTDSIPSDYDGVMGVPISFLDKYNPEQFELLGSNRGIDQDPNGIYGQGSYLNGKETFKRIFIKHKKNKRLGKLFFRNKIMEMRDLENYLDNIYMKSRDKRLSETTVRRKIIELVEKASGITSFSVQDLLSQLDLKPNDQTIEALESFLAELRSIFWLNDFGFTEIIPLQARNIPQPDFTAKFNNKVCAIEVFCLTEKHEQQKDSRLNAYVNFNPNFNGSKFGRDFMSKAKEEKKKQQLDAIITQMKILLCVLNSQPVVSLNTSEEMDFHAESLYKKLGWGQGYFVGILTGVEVNGKSSNTIYPRLV